MLAFNLCFSKQHDSHEKELSTGKLMLTESITSLTNENALKSKQQHIQLQFLF